MSPSMMGVVVGVIFGGISYFIVRMIADNIEFAERSDESEPDERRKTAAILRKVAGIDFLVFPVIGYFVGPYIL